MMIKDILIKTDISIISNSMMTLLTATHAMRIGFLILKQLLHVMDHSLSTCIRSTVLHAEQLIDMFSLFSQSKG